MTLVEFESIKFIDGQHRKPVCGCVNQTVYSLAYNASCSCACTNLPASTRVESSVKY